MGLVWLQQLKMKFNKPAFADSVLQFCGCLIDELLEDDNDESRKKIQETIGFPCFDIIRQNPQLIDDFRKWTLETVSKIVSSDYPLFSMRKELISKIHLNGLYRILFSKKFYDRRHELYQALNNCSQTEKETFVAKDPSIQEAWSETLLKDETASMAHLRTEAQFAILKMLHSKYFERVNKNDWFETYSKAHQSYIEMMFELALKKGKYDSSINSVLFPAFHEQLKTMRMKLAGEEVF